MATLKELAASHEVTDDGLSPIEFGGPAPALPLDQVSGVQGRGAALYMNLSA